MLGQRFEHVPPSGIVIPAARRAVCLVSEMSYEISCGARWASHLHRHRQAHGGKRPEEATRRAGQEGVRTQAAPDPSPPASLPVTFLHKRRCQLLAPKSRLPPGSPGTIGGFSAADGKLPLDFLN